MNKDDSKNNPPPRFPPKAHLKFFNPKNIIAIYTIICVLLKMRRVLGLEAMLEFMEKYQGIIKRHNPHYDLAVNKALAMMSVKKIYRDAVGDERIEN